MTVRSYRPYQVDIHKFVAKKREGNFGVEAPTGSGKTMQIVGLVAHAKKNGHWKKILVATTQQQIEEAIVHRDYDAISYGKTVLQAPDSLISQARDGSRGTRAAVKAFLTDSEEFAMACTHATCTTFPLEGLPDDLTGHLLIADEGHHMPADGFSAFEKAWVERGGTVAVFTATGYRADGKKVGTDDMEWFVRPMAQHMEEGYAPANLHYGVVTVKKRTHVSYEQFTGSKAPPKPFVGDIVRAMVKEWERLGRPKAIIQVPPMAGGTQTLVRAIKKAFEREGLKVVDATGEERKKEFLCFVKEESRRRWKDSQADIVVGSMRLVEGTDWPPCEAVFRVGIPGSVTTIVQLTGRAMRKKDSTCPKKRAELANVVFFVPTGSNNTLKKMSVDHSRAVLMISCFMADSKSGQQWLLDKELRRFKRKMHPEDPSGRADILVQMAAIRRQATREGRQVTLDELVRETKKKLPSADPELIKRITVEALAKSRKGGKVKDFIDKEYGIRPTMSKTAKQVLDAIVEEFRDVTLDGEDSMETLGRQAHLLDGGNISEWAERVAESLPLSEDQVLQWADEWHTKHGRWPKEADGQIPGTNETWQSVSAALKNGYRGLKGGKTLHDLLYEHRDFFTESKRSFQVKDALRWADAWFKQTGKWPLSTSGRVPGERITWGFIDRHLRAGTLGAKTTLPLLLKKHRGVRYRLESEALEVKQIAIWARAWFKKTGQWPNVVVNRSDRVPGTNETWGTIDTAFRQGRRGLEKSSLYKWIQSLPECARSSRSRFRVITHAQVLDWADEYFRKSGQWPTKSSGTIPGTSETWKTVANAMKSGSFGLPKYPLPKFLYDNRGIRSASATNQLSESAILSSAREWFQKHGKWPSADTRGQIPGLNDTWKNVNQALMKGSRGLTPGNSLARLLEPLKRETGFKVDLTDTFVTSVGKQWFHQTGGWPTDQTEGIVPGTNLTWKQLGDKLRRRHGRSLHAILLPLKSARPSPGSSRIPAGGGSREPSSGGSSRRRSPRTEASPAE